MHWELPDCITTQNSGNFVCERPLYASCPFKRYISVITPRRKGAGQITILLMAAARRCFGCVSNPRFPYFSVTYFEVTTKSWIIGYCLCQWCFFVFHCPIGLVPVKHFGVFSIGFRFRCYVDFLHCLSSLLTMKCCCRLAEETSTTTTVTTTTAMAITTNIEKFC